MFRIAKNGETIVTVNSPTYVCLAENGCFVLCEAAAAQGVVIGGEVYHIEGKPALDGKESVAISEVSETQCAMEQQRAVSAVAVVFATLAESVGIDGKTAAAYRELFSPWAANVKYAAGNIRKFGEKLYKCLQAHTSQQSWTPDVSPSLWVCISDPAEEYPEWVQPLGSTDAYSAGDKVTHNGKKWISTVDNNTWEPGVFGWDEVKEEG